MKSPLAKYGSSSNGNGCVNFLVLEKKNVFQGFEVHVIYIFSISGHNSQ